MRGSSYSLARWAALSGAILEFPLFAFSLLTLTQPWWWHSIFCIVAVFVYLGYWKMGKEFKSLGITLVTSAGFLLILVEVFARISGLPLSKTFIFDIVLPVLTSLTLIALGVLLLRLRSRNSLLSTIGILLVIASILQLLIILTAKSTDALLTAFFVVGFIVYPLLFAAIRIYEFRLFSRKKVT